MVAVLSLPARIDNAAAEPLRQLLLARRGAPLQLDASGVEKLGTLSVQVLLAARKTWEADGLSLAVRDASEIMVAKLAQIGLTAARFETGAV